MTQNSSESFLVFKMSTLRDLEHEHPEFAKSMVRTIDLTLMEKFVLYMHPFFRKSPLHYFMSLIFLLAYFIFCVMSAFLFCWSESTAYERRQDIFQILLKTHRVNAYEKICEQFELQNCNKTFLADVFDKYDKFLKGHLDELMYEVEPWPWSLYHSLGFVIWCFSTIGDGKMYPRTTEGRLLCIGLSIIGIPLFLLVVGYYGRAINHFFATVFYQKSIKPTNDSPALIKNSVNLVVHESKLESLFINNAPRMKLSETRSGVNLEMFGRSRQVTTTKYEEEPQHVQENNNEVAETESEISNESTSHTHTDEDIRTQQQIILPIKVAALILCVYTALGAYILMEQTGWNYVVSFYYLHITFTTIGFGDKDPWRVMTVFHYLYIFLGLTLTAMVFESVKEFMSMHFKKGMNKIMKSANILRLDGEILMIPYNLMQVSNGVNRILKMETDFE